MDETIQTDALPVQMGVPMEFITTNELLEEFANRGHNYVLIYADSTAPNDPTNLIVDYIGDGTAISEDTPQIVTNGPWLLWALAQAFVALYDKNLAWRQAEDGGLHEKARVNNRLRRIYNECEALIDTCPNPFEEVDP